MQEGRIELWSDGTWTRVPARKAVFLPRGVPHNCGDAPLRILVHAAPAGFEIFFERIAEACAASGGPDMRKIGEIAARHAIQFLPPG